MPRLLRRILLGLHAFVVAVLIGLFYVLSALGPDTDANIGAGLVGLVLLGLGLPWTLLIWFVDTGTWNDLPPAVQQLIDFGPAVLNVMVHATVTAVRGRVRGQSATVAGGGGGGGR